MRASTVRIKTFEAPTTSALETAYEQWRATLREETFVDARLAYVESGTGTTIILTVFYTE